MRTADFIRCVRYPGYFVAEHCVVRHPTRGVVPFALWDWQYELLNAFTRDRLLVILKARQIGCSELVAAYALWLARFHAGKMILLLSKSREDSGDLLARIGFMCAHLPDDFAQDGCRVLRQSATTLELGHLVAGRVVPSTIRSLPASRSTGRGKPASLIVLDEWAHMPWPDDIYAAIQPTIASGGQCIGLSTAKGLGNRFHRVFDAARAGENTFAWRFYGWQVHPERDAAWYAVQQRDLEPWMLHQEHPSSPDEAFIQTGRPVFDAAFLDVLSEHAASAALQSSSEGLDTWEGPNTQLRYVIGADVAEGLAHGDYHAACVVALDDGGVRQVAALRGKWPPDVFAARLAALGREYGDALLVVERNNHGHVVIAELLRADYPHLYYHAEPLTPGGRDAPRAGWPTTRPSKALIVGALAGALRQQTYRPRCAVFYSEARVFAYQDDGNTGAPAGFHDDTVIAAALAVYCAGLPESGERAGRFFDALEDLYGQAERET